jgi:DNA-binding NtrC family response regulator
MGRKMQAIPMRETQADHAMTNRVLIVEDDLIIALDLEDMVTGHGFEVAGLASSLEHALSLAPGSDIAFVDVNLSDGASGPVIGRILAEDFGIAVVFMTGNAEVVADGVRGTLGVVSKPVSPRTVAETLDYVAARRVNTVALVPTMLRLFAA